jgi:hypothetical protein
MKKSILTTLLCLKAMLCFSQEVKFKKDIILVDKKEFLSFEKGGTFGAVSYDLYELVSKKRIITLVYNNGGTHMELSDDYTQIKFITTGVKAEISGGDLRQAIKILLKNDVLKPDGTIDESKIELFIKNYDENISNRTIINR